MQEEVTGKSVAVIIKGAKISEKVLEIGTQVRGTNLSKHAGSAEE